MEVEEPAVSSASEAEMASPVTTMADNGTRKKTSFDFVAKIKELELEGNKLRAATVSTLSNISSSGMLKGSVRSL